MNIIEINDNFDVNTLLDLNFKKDDDVTEIIIKHTWNQIDEGLIEKVMVFFYNKVMDDNAKVSIASDIKNLSTENKIAFFNTTFKNMDYCVDESVFETFFMLTRVDVTGNEIDWEKTMFNDPVEFVDVKLGVSQSLIKLIRQFVVYYMSLISGLTGNRILHTSSFFELFISTHKGLSYFGELLTNFALSSVEPIRSEELYVVQNRNEIYDSMMLASTIMGTMDIFYDGLLNGENTCQ